MFHILLFIFVLHFTLLIHGPKELKSLDIFNLICIVWGIGFFYIIKTFKLMIVYDRTSSDLILKTVMDHIIMLDSTGIIITCNQATEDILKYNLAHIINKPLADFCKSKKCYQLNLTNVFNEHSVLFKIKYYILKYRHTLIYILVSMCRISHKSNRIPLL
jgi:PAS domain-containing protein